MSENEYLLWLTKYVCADCDPNVPGGDSEYALPFVVFVHRGQPCPLDHCPQCGGYLGFTEMGEYLARHKAIVPEAERL